MANSRDALLDDIETFLRTSGISASVFGERLMNDRHLVRRLRDGREVTLSTADRIREFIVKNRHKNPKRRACQPAA